MTTVAQYQKGELKVKGDKFKMYTINPKVSNKKTDRPNQSTLGIKYYHKIIQLIQLPEKDKKGTKLRRNNQETTRW